MKRMSATAVKYTAAVLARTWRIRTSGAHNLAALKVSGHPFIYALWHNQILPLLWHHRGTEASLLVSSHRDGGLLVDAAVAWGFHVIRGSSTRGGYTALRGAVRALESGRPVAITPDGPRGPARSVKPGILKLAELSASPILPVVARVRGAWRLESWDRFVVPAPFAAIDIRYLPPIRVTAHENRADITSRLTAALNQGVS